MALYGGGFLNWPQHAVAGGETPGGPNSRFISIFIKKRGPNALYGDSYNYK